MSSMRVGGSNQPGQGVQDQEPAKGKKADKKGDNPQAKGNQDKDGEDSLKAKFKENKENIQDAIDAKKLKAEENNPSSKKMQVTSSKEREARRKERGLEASGNKLNFFPDAPEEEAGTEVAKSQGASPANSATKKPDASGAAQATLAGSKEAPKEALV